MPVTLGPRAGRVIGLTAALVAAHGVMVLLGWWAAWPLFVRPPQNFIPMAPSTALVFTILGLALIGRRAAAVRVRRAGSLAAWAMAVVSLLSLGFPAWLDQLLGGATGWFGLVQLGVMSPITGGAAILLAVAIGLHGSGHGAASICATLAAVVGAIVTLGYIYGTPLLYGSAIIPVALPTGLSFVLLGSVTVAACPNVWPLQPLVGDSPRARMLRAFLPATTGLVVLLGLADARFSETIGANRVLVAGWLAIVGVALVTLLVSRIARRIGVKLDAASTALHQSEARYHQLFKNMLGGFALHEIICDEHGMATDYRFLEMNPAFEQITGLQADRIRGRTVREVLPDIEQDWIERYGRVALGGDPIRFEQRSGPLGRDFEVVAFSPHPGQFATIFADVTDRKRAEEAIRRSERQYRDVFDYAPVGIAQTSPDGRLLAANGTLIKMLGYSDAEELLGLNLATDVYVDSGERAAILSRLTSVPSLTGLEVRWKRKDGKTIWVQLSVTAVKEGHNANGLYYQAFVLDITRRKSLEEQLVQAQKMEAIGRLAGGVAHDFNNLLTVILGEADLAPAELPGGHPVRESLEEIRRAGVRAAALTRQLLIFSRKQIAEPTVFDLRDLVADAEKMLRRLIGEDIQLETRHAAEPGVVKADRGQIEQVLMNLVVNARDAMPGGGGVVLETRNVTLDEEYARDHGDVAAGDYVMLAVSDTGTGMSDEVRAHVFEPFFTTKGKGAGTGLGLATSYGIVKQAGGHIAVYTEAGIGTTMKIYLPRTGELATAERPDESTVPRGTETVLLVEDETQVRQVAVRMLRAQGYTVIEAAHGAEALRLIERESGPIHLLITDVVLPGMNGRVLAEQVKKGRPDIRLMFISGYTDDVVLRRQLLEHGATLVHKPFTAQVLARKLREVLDAPMA